MRGEHGDRRSGSSRPVAGGAPPLRTVGLGAGAVLAVAATVVVFLTDNPQVLRLAVVGGAWAFVLALLAMGRRPAGRPADPGRDAEPGLARGAADGREQDTDRAQQLRRESEDGMRAELAALRRDLTALSGLRRDVAALSGLRNDVAALPGLRNDVAALSRLRQDVAELAALRSDVLALSALRQDIVGPGGLREEVAALAAVRGDLGQLAELRADMGRLRAELTEQLSSEMLVERIVMRTQSSRAPGGAVEGPATRTLEAAAAWAAEPPRGLTGSRPAVRLDDLPAQAPATDPSGSAAGRNRRRRSDDAATAEQLTVERPASAPRESPVRQQALEAAWPTPPAPRPPEPEPEPLTVQAPGMPTPGEARLAQILAESGVRSSSGSRRRHRYRDEDEDDDVLARVLGRS